MRNSGAGAKHLGYEKLVGTSLRCRDTCLRSERVSVVIGPERNTRRRWRQLTNLVKLIERRLRCTQPSAQQNQPPSPLQDVNENTALLLKGLAMKAKEDLRIGRANLWCDIFALAIKLAEVVARIRTRFVGLNQRDVGRRRLLF